MRLRRAAVSPKLMTVLVLALIVTGGVWFLRCRTAVNEMSTTEPMTLYCPTCGKQETTNVKLERLKFQCPKCMEFIADFQDPNAAPPDIVQP